MRIPQIAVFCKCFLAVGGLVPISGRFGWVAAQPDGDFLMKLIGILTNRHNRRREKVFGKGRCRPLDRNAKVRITAYAQAWTARHKQPGQHRGPLTRAYLEVLEALLWGFHNSRDGRCFPSYETIAARAQCCRDTVCAAIKALELAGVMTWVNRLVRVDFRERDQLGNLVKRTRVVRTSNAYLFRDPLAEAAHPNCPDRARDAGQKPAESLSIASKSENPSGTQTQDSYKSSIEKVAAEFIPSTGLGRALKRLQTAIGAKAIAA
jgi:hypothetical protein